MFTGKVRFLLVLALACILATGCNMAAVNRVTDAPEDTPAAGNDGPSGDASTDEPDSAGRSVTFRRVEGTVNYRPAGAEGYSRPAVGDVMTVGGEIGTGADGYAVLELDDGTVISLSPDSIFSLSEMAGTTEKPITRFFLNIGEVFAFREGLEKLPEDAAFDVQTSQGVAAIRGSSMGVRAGQSSGPKFILICLSGACIAINPGGQQVNLGGGDVIEIDEVGEFSEVVVISTANFLAGQFACMAAQGAGLLDTLTCGNISVTPATQTPTPTLTPRPTATPTPTITPTVGPNVTTQVFPVYFCEYIGNRDFQWYEVQVTYENRQPVKEEILSGPYTGPWTPGCPGNVCAETSCGDQVCQANCGEDYQTCGQDCPAPYTVFLGTWYNDNPNTGQNPLFSIRESKGVLFVHMYGACSPTNCDWGEQPVPTAEANDGTFSVTYDFGFIIVYMTMTMMSDGGIQVYSINDFQPPDTRTDYTMTEYFHK